MDEQPITPAPQAVQPAPTAPVSEVKKTGSGLDPKIAAALCWAFAPISSIVFIAIEKEDKYVKFHAYQSLFAGIAIIVASIIASMLVIVLIGLLLVPLVSIVAFVIWLLGMFKAYQGEMWKLPVIGDMAEEYANK